MSNFKKTKHKKRKGRCFELALSYILDDKNKFLVHGTVKHVSGDSMAHAWIEDEEGNVYDLVKNEIYQGSEYYKDFNAKKMFVYSYKEAAIKISEFGHSGPWEQKNKRC